MIYKKQTQHTIGKIQEMLPIAAKEEGFGVLKQYHFKDILQEKGFPIDEDITVFELCNPSAAQEALSSHPEVAVFLPCRIALYKEQSNIMISTIGIEEMIQGFELDDTFKAYMEETYSRLIALIERLR
jgi:uncharacterized protein (DUF302 family)